MATKQKEAEDETEAERREMNKEEFFDDIIEQFKNALHCARNSKYGVSNYSEDRAKELLEIAKIRDLEILASTWEYIFFDEDGRVYWYDGEDKNEAILIRE